MRLLFVYLLIFSTLFANVATVVDSVGQSHLIRGGRSIKVVKKQQLKEHDTIKTGENAKVKIFFKDNTAVSLGQNTTFKIDSYLFTGKQDSQIKFKVLKGFFKVVTGKIGKIAPNRFKLQTKNATIGIRGTVFAANVNDSVEYIICTDGKIIILTSSGKIEIDKGKISSVKKGAKPKVRRYSDKQREELIKNAGWHGSMSMKELIAYIKKTFAEPLKSQLLATLQNILNKDSKERELYLGKPKSKNADDKSFVDSITINDREFDELPNEVEFYQEDLKDGKVIVQGILESEDKNMPINSLHVEITTDGGESWSRAKGSANWEWSFKPKLEHLYEFSLRVVQTEKYNDTPIVIAGAGMVKKQYAKAEEKVSISKMLTTEPIVLKFKQVTSKTIITEPILLKFKNQQFQKFNPKLGNIGIASGMAFNADKELYTVNTSANYETTTSQIKFKLKKPTVYETTTSQIKFKLKKPTVYETTTSQIKFKLKKPTVYETITSQIKFKLKKPTVYETTTSQIKFKLR